MFGRAEPRVCALSSRCALRSRPLLGSPARSRKVVLKTHANSYWKRVVASLNEVTALWTCIMLENIPAI